MAGVQQKMFGVDVTHDGEIHSTPDQAANSAMYQELNESVDVLVLFEGGRVQPQRFRWKGHVHRVSQITGNWNTAKGVFKLRHFALMDEDANFFQLAYDERKTQWKVTRVWVE